MTAHVAAVVAAILAPYADTSATGADAKAILKALPGGMDAAEERALADAWRERRVNAALMTLITAHMPLIKAELRRAPSLHPDLRREVEDECVCVLTARISGPRFPDGFRLRSLIPSLIRDSLRQHLSPWR